jgi:hypothetical protein
MVSWVDTSAGLLRRQLSHAFAASRWQVEGLTDDEYFWEPHPGCWSVRRRAPSVSATSTGVGEWIVEWSPAENVATTTIAWRLVHLAAWTDVYRDWTFGAATRSFDDLDVPHDAATAVQLLHRVQDEYSAAVGRLDDRDFEAMRPVHWGANFPIGVLVWQIAVEHLHHSAEIGVLRDIRRGRGRGDWWPEPLTAP